MKIWLTASEFNWQFNWMFEHRQMQQSDNTKPTFFLCKKDTRAKCAKKNMTLIVTVDCLIVFSYLISKICVQGLENKLWFWKLIHKLLKYICDSGLHIVQIQWVDGFLKVVIHVIKNTISKFPPFRQVFLNTRISLCRRNVVEFSISIQSD